MSDHRHRLHFSTTLQMQYFNAAQQISLSDHFVSYTLDLETIAQWWMVEVHHIPSYLAQANRQRLNEFFSGRILLQAILLKHFNYRHPVTCFDQRLPALNENLRCSISHSNKQLIVIVADQRSHLGVDIEYWVDTRFAEKSLNLILSEAEKNIWDKHCNSRMSFQQFVTFIFSAKESLYKAVYPKSQQYIDFLDVALISLDMMQRRAIFKFKPQIVQQYHLELQYNVTWRQYPDYLITATL